MKHNLLEIETSFHNPKCGTRSADYHLLAIQDMIRGIIPQELLNEPDETLFFKKLSNTLPLLGWSSSGSTPYHIHFGCLCFSEYTHGVGRFVSDMCSRWLLPGKQLPIVSTSSLAFRFKHAPHLHCFAHELLTCVDSVKDMDVVRGHIDTFIWELRMSILVVKHARSIVSSKPLSQKEKNHIIQENIASLLNRPSKDLELNTFDSMHHFLLKLTGEEKISKLQNSISPLVELKPQLFERDIFNELQQDINLFKEQFVAAREIKHITRIISFKYLFKKTLERLLNAQPDKRHISFKILPSRVYANHSMVPVLGILVAINLLRENELFEHTHVLTALQNILPDCELVEGSAVLDRRGNLQVRTLYLETRKNNLRSFSIDDIRQIKKQLPIEIKSHIQSVINPVFMPRNEEEVMRLIVTLSNQLRYSSDLPQVNISFHKQTANHLTFTVVMLRLLSKGQLSFKEAVGNHPQISNIDSKIVGHLRKRTPKEATVFELSFDKSEFLLKDFTLDLFQARQRAAAIVQEAIGEIRDFNGGMISKQSEVYSKLCDLLGDFGTSNEFILRNFFYSITPIHMQSLLPAEILKRHFLMITDLLAFDYNQSPMHYVCERDELYFYCAFGSIDPLFRKEIQDQIEKIGLEPISCKMHTYDIFIIGYILKIDDPLECKVIEDVVSGVISNWHDTQTQPTHALGS